MDQRPDRAWADVEALLADLVAQQEGKVLGLARERRADAAFHYEDGLLAGLQAALAAVRARRSGP